MTVRGRQEPYWPMREGGPYDEGREIFKCTGCGAETTPEAGWNGEPDKHQCRPGCPCAQGDLKIGGLTDTYRRNFDRIFPNAPGAGL